MKYVDLRKIKEPEKKKSRGITKTIPVVLVFIAAVVSLYIFRENIKSYFDPISIVASITNVKLDETDGRTNILLMGSDRRLMGAEKDKSVLTDTLLLASIGRTDKDVVLISLPRDLWVQSPKGYHSKINAVYAISENNNPGTGSEQLKEVIEEVLGITIHYHALITFELFKEAIDTLEGIEVHVDNSFTDNLYPVEGMENAPVIADRYETVHFDAGVQTMDGETALKFVRSRKGDNGEGTDFARSKRQQKVISAIKDKALSLQTLVSPGKIKELFEIYKQNVDTNMDLATTQSLYLLSQQINFDKVVSVVLDDRSVADEGGLLYAPEDKTLYGDQYVLIPQTGNYSQIHAYVQRYLFGNK